MATTRAARGRTPRFTLRTATAADYDFALALYLESPRELLEPLGRWDEARFTARFREVFKPGVARVIRVDGADIGWMHASELPDRIHVHYMLISAPFRSRGIGTSLMRRLQDRARTECKPLTLNVLRANHRAIVLYDRLSFRRYGGDTERLRMRWNLPTRRTSSTHVQRLRRS